MAFTTRQLIAELQAEMKKHPDIADALVGMADWEQGSFDAEELVYQKSEGDSAARMCLIPG